MEGYWCRVWLSSWTGDGGVSSVRYGTWRRRSLTDYEAVGCFDEAVISFLVGHA